ncbi:MAG: SDR family oxidoreductase [Acidobacteriota bacterium]
MALFLVTGGAGFIGSAVVQKLRVRGERVRVVDNVATGQRKNLHGVLSDADFYEGDIAELDVCHQVMQGVDYVLHQAALPSVPRSLHDPLATHRSNVTGTVNLLVAAREAKVKRFVIASSSSIYGNTPTLPKVETMPPAPLSPYAVSKLAAEQYALVFFKVFGQETVALRYFNIFGPRQDPNSPYSGVLSRFITALLRGKRPTIYGDGLQSRDFTYVDNAVQANLLACEAPHAAGKVFNIATGARHTLMETLAMMSEIIGVRAEPCFASPRPGEVRHSQADIRLAQEVLGYRPTVGFREGLEKTIAWYRENMTAVVNLAKGD